jgi:hypothetical protein
MRHIWLAQLFLAFRFKIDTVVMINIIVFMIIINFVLTL